MAPQGDAYNVDWVVSPSSNVHVASDRAWFTDYTPFTTKISAAPGAEPSVEVHGVGTVVLHTRTYGKGKPPKPACHITLTNVLYVPGNPVNIFSTMKMESDVNIKFRFGSNAVEPIIKRDTNHVLGLVVRLKLHKLWLQGQSRDQSSLDPDGMYYIYASWPGTETERYNNRLTQESQAEHVSNLTQAEPPYTTEEKEFLKRCYGGEFDFLMTLGLKIHDEDDREEGRHTLRTLRADSDGEAKPKSNKRPRLDSDATPSREATQMQAYAAHLADRKFTSDQLDFIQKHYHNSGHFMRCHDLDSWQDGACDEAVKTVKTLITHEHFKSR
ncbi:hypothetical protein D6D26_04437 [Aureobasidium pullulans]|nr:hypothetical protein D6D26_04437 [Aureobasidium pullulans]